MMAGLRRVMGYALLAGAGGCATQQGTSQALTVAGAAAVVIGASMAADEQCYGGLSEGAALVYCAENPSKAVRNTGKGIAVAGVALAAAGYALEPKGPDNKQRVRPDPHAAPASPYRLIRRAPPLESPSESALEGSLRSAGVLQSEASDRDVSPGDVSPGDVSPGDVSPGDVSPGDVSEPRPESPPSAAEPVEPPGPCARGGRAGSAGACSPEKAPAAAPSGGPRRPPP